MKHEIRFTLSPGWCWCVTGVSSRYAWSPNCCCEGMLRIVICIQLLLAVTLPASGHSLTGVPLCNEKRRHEKWWQTNFVNSLLPKNGKMVTPWWPCYEQWSTRIVDCEENRTFCHPKRKSYRRLCTQVWWGELTWWEGTMPVNITCCHSLSFYRGVENNDTVK